MQALGYFVFGLYVLTSLWLLLNGLLQLHLLWHYKRKKKAEEPAPLTGPLPFVSVQVPVYNEKYVIEGLLDALAGLDYPKDRYEIQVLDDSTDETSALIDDRATALQRSGIAISVLRRKEREGFKAGALQYGLSRCRGELIAIFDADFRPRPSFLKSLLPHFAQPRTGMVQARWGHLNREQNGLTRIQTFLLDTHFSVEQEGRAGAGYFINFCGTAGIWRKACIEDAGGWDGSVLSEDLDLSYRAQLRGWTLVYDADTVVPAELPCVMEAFKVQQFRWTKGMAQIFRKNSKGLLQAAMPFGKKLHGFFHLLGSFVFVCLFLNALLTLPMLIFRNLYPEIRELTSYTVITSVNLLVLTLFYYTGTRSGRTAGPVLFFRHYPMFLVVYMGLSVQNALAVLQGFFGYRSEFVRTPKFNVQAPGRNAYLGQRISPLTLLEGALLLYFLGGVALSIYFNDYFLLLFFLMIATGLGILVFQSVRTVLPRWRMWKLGFRY
ncbi:MAG TPA: glycosyltransferase [Chitinophagaceae bacterium]|nr:glycosyltransferase [Chitinophagaceae bacterium]